MIKYIEKDFTTKRKNMYCSKCGIKIDDGQTFCDKCGARVGSAEGGGQNTTYVVSIRDKSAGIAAVLSFLVMGLGQIYVGKIARGLLLMFSYIVFVVIEILLIFAWLWDPYSSTMDDDFFALAIVLLAVSVCYFILWIWNIFDAYKKANEYNDSLRATGKRPW